VLVAGAILVCSSCSRCSAGSCRRAGLLGAVAAPALVAAGAAVRPGDALLGGYSALVYVLLFAPIVIVVVYAFNEGRQVEVWEGLSAKWFGEALENEEIRSAIGRSLRIAVASALVATALGTATALALLKARSRTRVSFDVVLFLALVVPELVLAIAALIFFVNAGFELGELTMFLGHTIFNTALVTLVVRARAVSMGEGHEEASADLGAGPLSTFRQVTLPRLFPAILAAFLLTFTFSFDDVIISSFTSGAGNQTWPLRVLSALRFGLSPEVNATATMMLGVTLVGLGLGALVLRVSARRQGAQGLLGLSRGDVAPAAPVAAGG
jgi:spermidine/putrescine transport system permease protein/putrescine transport system permease protein